MTEPFFGGNTYEVHNGHFLSTDMMELAGELQERYYNLKLVWIPPENRGPEDKGREFAIINMADNDTPVLRMSPEQVHRNFIFNWLEENDAEKHGEEILNRMLKDAERAEKAKQDARKEHTAQQADVIGTIIKSGKHGFRHNGVTLNSSPDAARLILNAD